MMLGGLVWRVSKLTIVALIIISATGLAATKRADDDDLRRQALRKVTATPNTQNCSHRVGNVFFTVTNWGFFGSQFNDASDWLPELYCIGPGVTQGELAPSFEFPAGTGVNYLFQGAFWIGAVADDDTIVSVGADGWQRVHEMYPRPAPLDDIVQMSTRKTSEFYSTEAVSEQDYISEYTDTLIDAALTERDAILNRPHKPLGIKIIQRSYSWSFSYAEDFVLMDFKIVNIGQRDLRKMYMALYVDADIWHVNTPDGFADDITGYLESSPTPACPEIVEDVNIAWTADFDGDPVNNVFNEYSPSGVAGTRVVRSPNPELQFSFNWWVSNGDDTNLDWGPRRIDNNRDYGGYLGTPEGDRNKYYIMSRPEFDYDQIFSAVDHTAAGWLPPSGQPGLAPNLADGYDTRYLFSFGPFELPPGDSLPITIAYAAGDKFHRNPNDFRLFNETDPSAFYASLDFSDLVTNSLWAGWVYDNPGIDTDSNGVKSIAPITDPDPHFNPCTGKEYYKYGDGVPDFAGPPPPPAPQLRFSASPGRVELRWNGEQTETSEDPFSFLRDFEGYRVYMGTQLVLSEFALLTSFDTEDYNRYRLNLNFDPVRWELTEVPFTLDSLRDIYGPGFDPAEYPNQSDSLAWVDEGGIQTAYYFTKQDYNRSTLGEAGSIRKAFPDAQPGDMIWVEELNDSVDAYYEYEYIIDGLLASRPLYFAVSSFDYGNPATSLAALESSPLANAIQVYPVNSADRVVEEGLNVTVFPNPYRVDGGYLEAGYERLDNTTASTDRARRIHFANLPKEATIRIYTLDGDLVREIQHPCDCPFQEGESMLAWDLITRNTQAAVSGIYLYSVQSAQGNQVGKFVIIR